MSPPQFLLYLLEFNQQNDFTSNDPHRDVCMMLHICSHILALFVVKFGDDEEERKTLMKSRD